MGRIGLLAQLLGMGQDVLTLASLGAALVAYNPWLLLLLAASVIPGFLGETHFASLGYSLLFRRTPERRQLDYLRMVGASDRTAKEVQMFGLAGWLTERYRVLADRFYEENRALSVGRAVVSTALSWVCTAGYYGAFALILVRAVAGAISVARSPSRRRVARSRRLVQRLLTGATDVFEQSSPARSLRLLELKRRSSPPRALPVPNPIREGFVFDNVGFRYPGGERWAIRGVSFALGPGERLALVGENGAGKTTITKLVARLYEPTEGRILLDGVDLREYDLASVRAAVGVIFQDFVRYDAARRDSPSADRHRARLPRLVSGETRGCRAAAGGARESAERRSRALPARLAGRLSPYLLGRRFEGVDLSGGEWQKVALARAYMRDAQLLVLDEPTAALDARAEYEVFVRFSELMRGRMAILISHRFSTVRMADRILVLEDGRIMESGSPTTRRSAGGTPTVAMRGGLPIAARAVRLAPGSRPHGRYSRPRTRFGRRALDSRCECGERVGERRRST